VEKGSLSRNPPLKGGNVGRLGGKMAKILRKTVKDPRKNTGVRVIGVLNYGKGGGGVYREYKLKGKIQEREYGGQK